MKYSTAIIYDNCSFLNRVLARRVPVTSVKKLVLFVVISFLLNSCVKTTITLPLSDAENALPGTWLAKTFGCTDLATTPVQPSDAMTWVISSITHTVASDNATIRIIDPANGTDVTSNVTIGKKTDGSFAITFPGNNQYKFTCGGNTLTTEITYVGGIQTNTFHCKYTYQRQ